MRMSDRIIAANGLVNAMDTALASVKGLGRHPGTTSGARYRSSVTRLTILCLQMILDAVVIVATFAGMAAAFELIGLRQRFGGRELEALPALVPIFLAVSGYVRSYSVRAMQSYTIGATRVLHAWAATVATALLIAFTRQISDDFSRSVLLSSAAVAPLLLVIVRCAIIKFVQERSDLRLECAVLIEDGLTVAVPDEFDRICAETLLLEPDVHNPISLHNFSCIVAHYDRVVVASRPEDRGRWALYLQAAGCAGELLMPELEEIMPPPSENPLHLPTVRVSSGPLDLPNRVLKRLLDLAITVPLIVFFAPLMAVIALAVKLDSSGPILFRQQRMGRGNRLFNVYKFRSMRVEQLDFSGSRSATRDDDRITRVGRLIRMTSLDELPQLINVLQGDMALVGPRPHALGSRAGADLFWHVDPRYWLRHSIKPGITGLAQVRGYRGATDHRDDLTNRLRSDLEYVANWSIFRDLLILVRTAAVVVHSKAY